MTKRQAFYTGRIWARFLSALKNERTDADGFLRCEHCGKPIVKAYDCIGHHITELTDDNVDDVTIAMNPENVMLVHFRCHNEIHERFGYQGSIIKQVFLVYGAPCAGKTTFVDSVANPGDLILDIDRLWSAVRAGQCGTYDKPDALKAVVFDLRDCMMQDIRTRRGKWRNAYVIGGYPLEGERERIADMVGADKQIFIDTPQEICMQRAAQKSPEWSGYVSDWFGKYAPPVDA